MKETLIYGRNAVLESLGEETSKLFIQQGLKEGMIKKIVGRARDFNIPIIQKNKSQLDELCHGANHQGVISIHSSFEYSTVDEILEDAKCQGEDPLIVLLDQVQDPHNLGAIARSALALGAHGLVILKHRSASVSSGSYKSSAGAIDHLKIAQVTNLSQTIADLKDRGLWIYGADARGDEIYKTNLTGPVGLIIGAEGKGLRDSTKKHVDVLVSIPMGGKFESLNASAAASILLYEIQRQRHGTRG